MLTLKLNKRMWKWNAILVLSVMTVSSPAGAAEPVKGKDCLDFENTIKEIAAAPKVIMSTTDIQGLENTRLHPRLRAEAIASMSHTNRKVPGVGDGVIWKQTGCRTVTLILKSDTSDFQVEMAILGFSKNSLKLQSFDEERAGMEFTKTGPSSMKSTYTSLFDRSLTHCGEQISGKAQFYLTEEVNWGENPAEPNVSFHLVEALVNNQAYLLNQLNQNACSPGNSIQPTKFLPPAEQNNSGGSGDGYGKSGGAKAAI